MGSSRNRKAPRKDYAEIADRVVKRACAPSSKKKKKATAPKNAASPKKATKRAPVTSALLGVQQDAPPEGSPTPAQQDPVLALPPVCFTVSWSILWKEKEIWPGTSMSNEFNFHNFNTAAIKKVEAKA